MVVVERLDRRGEFVVVAALNERSSNPSACIRFFV